MTDFWMPGVPQAPCPNSHGSLAPTGGVVHKSIGIWPGDRDYIQRNSLAHFTIGPDEGDWAQHAPIDVVLYHCNGANFRLFGIEFSDLDPNGPLTEWQTKAWTEVRAWATSLGIPDTYVDPDSAPFASVPVDGTGFTGWISHYNVRTGDGSVQHTDSIPFASYLPTEEEDEFMAMFKDKDDFGVFLDLHIKKVLDSEGTGDGQKSWGDTVRATLHKIEDVFNKVNK